ncbi:hypothetical protein [Noviherbaspirillum galbum]|uniref:HAMP domain-containing protein n=1 Tax=Noviherbaspirillum galbum TaxID=2709383 RepID=A0A6B3SY60_9BURK|nr:hypothetical protein [Noviherbaspirillum galbum]NEX63552.1 hypothetical protein [Noviherbaspirillum galbum]
MSIFTIALPAHAVLPAFHTAVGASAGIMRPLLGFGMLAAFMMLFRPLLTGLLRAGLLVIQPRATRKERSFRSITEGVLALNRMARDVEAAHPSLASELRAIAARGN